MGFWDYIPSPTIVVDWAVEQDIPGAEIVEDVLEWGEGLWEDLIGGPDMPPIPEVEIPELETEPSVLVDPQLGPIVSPPAYTEDIIQNKISVIDVIPITFGKVKMAANMIRFSSGVDTRRYIFSFCEGEINSYDTIYINDVDWNDLQLKNLLINGDFENPYTIASAKLPGGLRLEGPQNWSSAQCGALDGIYQTGRLTVSSGGGGQSGEYLIIQPVRGFKVAIACQAVKTISGGSYNASVYVKSGTSGNGAVKLEAVDGTTQEIIANTSAVTSGSWTQITLSLTAQSDITLIRLKKDNDTMGNMLFDTAVLRWTSEERSKTEYTGTNSQTADPRFIYLHAEAYRNMAYLAMTLDNNNKQISGNPNVTAIIEGKKMAPIAGGANAFSRNPAVILWHIYTQVEGKATSELDQSEFQALETYCDAVPAGGTLPRYRFDYVFDTRIPVNDMKKLVWESFNGCCIWSQGEVKPVWERDKTSAFSFTHNNIVQGSFSWHEPTRANVIRINFINSAEDYKKDYVEERDEASIIENGEILYEVNALYITDEELARRRCKFLYKKNKYPDYVCELTGFPASSKVEILDVVDVTHTLPGWTAKKFTVRSKGQDENGRCRFLLEAYQKAFYNDETIEFQTDYSSSLPDPYAAPDPVTGLTLVEDAYTNRDGHYVPTVTVSYTRPTDITFWNYARISVRIDHADGIVGAFDFYGNDHTLGTGYKIDGDKAGFNVGDGVHVLVQSVNDNGVMSPYNTAPTEYELIDGQASRPALVKGLRIENKTTDYTWDGRQVTVVWRGGSATGGAGHELAGQENAGAGGANTDSYWLHDEVQIYIGGALRHTFYTKKLRYTYIYGDGQDDFLDSYVAASNGTVTFKVFRWNTFNLRSEKPAVITISNQNPATPIGLSSVGFLTSAEYAWTSANETDWDHYLVRVGVSGGASSSWKTIYNTTYPYFMSSSEIATYGPTPTIYFDVKSVDLYGNESSIASDFAIASAITTTLITDDCITTPKIVANSITAAKIAANTITANEIAARSITGDRLAVSAVTADTILARSISGDRLVVSAVTADTILARSISGDRLAVSAVTADVIAAGTITATEISGTAFGTLTISSGKIVFNVADSISIDAANGLTISNGGDINLEAGGDIIMAPSDANPALIKWSTGLTLGSRAAYDLCLWPGTAGQGTFKLGFDGPNNAEKLLHTINIRCKYSNWQRTYFDATHYARMEIKAAAAAGYIDFVAVNAGNVRTIRLEGTATDPRFYPLVTKAADLGITGGAWDDCWADDFNNEADFYCLDNYKDLETILNIGPSGKIDKRSGLPLIDDKTLPDWLLVKTKDGKNIIKTPNTEKPWVSNKAMFSLLMGAIKELNNKIETPNE